MPHLVAPPLPSAMRRAERRAWRSGRARAFALIRKPGVGSVLAVLLLLSAAAVGAVDGGQYQAFVARNGDLRDALARALGFGVDAVTITGARELTIQEVLRAAGVDSRSSLPFLDATAVRDRLLKLPLIKQASVKKLFPDRLVITLVERQPYALWQKDGSVEVIAQDGMPIDHIHDQRFDGLPFVVGDEANEHIGEFMSLLKAAGDLRGQIRAGVYVGDRRWDLNLKNGMIVRLPETAPIPALEAFVREADRYQLLDKDLLTIDMRIPGRMVVRISEQAEAARAAALARKHPRGGNP